MRENAPVSNTEKIDSAVDQLRVLDALIEEIRLRKASAETDCQTMVAMQRASNAI
jgi:hypothetical protein